MDNNQTVETIVTLLEKIAYLLTNINLATQVTEIPDDNRTMFPKEAAAYLGISYDTCLRWAREGIIPSCQPGGHRVLFRKQALDQCIAQKEFKNSKKTDADEKAYGKLRKIIA